MANPKTTFEFDGDVSKVIAKLNELEAKINKTGKGGKGAGEDIAGGFEAAVAGISKVAVGLSTAYAALSGVKKAIGTAAEFEQLQVRLENMYGSVERGREAFQKFQEVAATTPYSLQGVVEAGASLKAFGVDAEAMIKPVSDLAAFMGIDVVEAAQAFGRAMAGGAGAADILRERGILQLVKSFKGIDDLTKLTLPQFRQALIDTIQNPAAGIVGATDKMSKTFQGSLSNMMDAVDQLANVMGKKLLPAATTVMQGISGMVSSLLPRQSELLRENQYEFNALVDVLTDVNAAQETRSMAITELQSKYGSYLGNIDLEKTNYSDLKAELDKVNLAFDQRIKMMAAEELLIESEKGLADKRKAIFEREVYLREQMAKNPALNQNLIKEDPGLIWMRKGLDELTESHKRLKEQVLGNTVEIKVDVVADRIPERAANAGQQAGQAAGQAFISEYKATVASMDIAPPRALDDWAAQTQKLIEDQQTLGGKVRLVGEQAMPAAGVSVQDMAKKTNDDLIKVEKTLENIIGGMVSAGAAGQNMGDVLKKVLMDLVTKALALAVVFGIMQLIPGGSALTGGFGAFMKQGFGFAGGKSMQTTGSGAGSSFTTPAASSASLQSAQPVVVNVVGALDGQRFVTNTVRTNERRLGGRVF